MIKELEKLIIKTTTINQEKSKEKKLIKQYAKAEITNIITFDVLSY